jgi:hypothetical protein
MDRQTAALLLGIVGAGIFIVGWWPCMREMFEESRVYGYLAWIFPVLPMIYAALHWDDLQRPFWIQLVGALLFGASVFLRS